MGWSNALGMVHLATRYNVAANLVANVTWRGNLARGNYSVCESFRLAPMKTTQQVWPQVQRY
eukprot:660561-Amphidinium_carterae.1